MTLLATFDGSVRVGRLGTTTAARSSAGPAATTPADATPGAVNKSQTPFRPSTKLPSRKPPHHQVRVQDQGSRPNFQREGDCWNPRLKRFGAGGEICCHAWGIAIGINVDVNPFGARPVQGPRLVAIMEEHGFYWGGRSRRPDGTHFEWVT